MTALEIMLSKLADGPESFLSKMPDIEKKVFGSISIALKELNLDAKGNVVPNVANLKLISAIKAKLNRLLLSSDYKEAVKSFVKEFQSISNLNDQYFNWSKLPNSTMFKSVTDIAIDNTIESLAGSGYSAPVVSKLGDMLVKSVTSGGHYNDLIEGVRSELITTEKKQGLLSRYAKTYTTDALSQFSGQQIKLLSEGLNSEWFRYVGSNKETTREFCDQLTKKDYIHKTEIPDIVLGKIDGYQCEVNLKTKLPNGMIDGTNAENFIIYCGGYNCQHRLIPVNESAVPIQIRNKVKFNQQKGIKKEEDK